MAPCCLATQAGKSCHTTKLTIPIHILEVMGFFQMFFHSATDGFSNLLPLTYEMLHQQAATITSKTVLVAYAQGESKTWTHPQSCSFEPTHTRDHFVCSLQMWFGSKSHEHEQRHDSVSTQISAELERHKNGSVHLFLTQTFFILCCIMLFCSDRTVLSTWGDFTIYLINP